jgi:hypothetical protein
MIRSIFSIGFFCLTVYFGYTFFMQWKSPEHAHLGFFERLRCTARDSATILWSQFSLFISGVVANIDNVFTMLGLPDVANFINQWFNPRVAAAAIAVIATGSWLSRLRSLGKS